MRHKLVRELKKIFKSEFLGALPSFERVANMSLPKSDELYICTPNSPNPITLFLCLQPHHLYDCFSIDVAASRSLRWPPFPIGDPFGSPVEGDIRFRLRRPNRRRSESDAWWIGKNMRDLPLHEVVSDHQRSEDQLLPEIPSNVDDCILNSGSGRTVFPRFREDGEIADPAARIPYRDLHRWNAVGYGCIS